MALEASSVDTPKPARKATTTSPAAAKRPSPEAARSSRSNSRSPSRSARSRSVSSGLSAGSVRSPPAAGISSTFGKIRQMSDLVMPQVAKASTTPGPAACDHEGRCEGAQEAGFRCFERIRKDSCLLFFFFLCTFMPPKECSLVL